MTFDLNNIYEGNCFDLIKQLPDNSIDLVVTSPPYADVKSYGKKINVLHPDHYNDWILPLHEEIWRVLKPTGSYILNINDCLIKKQRHVFCLELPIRTIRETKLKLYDNYIWHKVKGYFPNAGSGGNRLNNLTEYLYHFVKDEKQVKWRMDNIREPYKLNYGDRFGAKQYSADDKGKRISVKHKSGKVNPKGKIPDDVFEFPTSAEIRGNKHPAPFHPEIPKKFILAFTDEGDVVLDPFMGSGSTAIAATELKRDWIGFELNPEYIKLAWERIGIEKPTETETEDQFNVFFE